MEVCPDITNTAQSRTYTKVECLWVVVLQAAYDVFVNIYYLPIPTRFILELTGQNCLEKCLGAKEVIAVT